MKASMFPENVSIRLNPMPTRLRELLIQHGRSAAALARHPGYNDGEGGAARLRSHRLVH